MTNRKYAFKNIKSLETGFSDHHHIIYTMLKSSFINEEQKFLTYTVYKTFCLENSKGDLYNALWSSSNWIDELDHIFITGNKHVPKRKSK